MEEPSPLIGSTPEPNCSGERVDIRRLSNWTRDGSGSILTLKSEGQETLSVRVNEPGPWWVGAHYRVTIQVAPLKDPIADEMNLDAIYALAVQMGIEKLKESGRDAVICYRMAGGADRSTDSKYSALETKAREADCYFQWLNYRTESGTQTMLGFLCLRPDMDAEELTGLID